MKFNILAGIITATLIVPGAVAEIVSIPDARILSGTELDGVTAGVISAAASAGAGAVSSEVVITHTETQASVYHNSSSTNYPQLDSSLAVGSGLAIAYGGVTGVESTGAGVAVSAPGAQTVGFAQTTHYDGVLFSISKVTAWEAAIPVNMATK